jgi:hypothetical protein
MDFGTRPVNDGGCVPVPEVTLRMAWFERSSAERNSVPERGLMDGACGLLDRVREGEGLVYNGEGDYEG